MSLFGSLLGAGVSLLGSGLSRRESERGTQAAMQASQPRNLFGPFGSVTTGEGGMTSALGPELQQAMGLFSGMLTPGALVNPTLQKVLDVQLSNFMRSGTDRDMMNAADQRLMLLRNRARPAEADARAAARNRVFSQGRLGLGVGGGQTNARFNPELAALEEGLARADIVRQDQALNLALGDRDRQFRELMGLQGLFSGLRTEDLSRQLAASNQVQQINRIPLEATRVAIGSQLPPAIAAMQAQPFFQGARSTESFFSGLGQGIADFGGGLFGGGGGGGMVNPVPINNPSQGFF